jgi:hypothetical protein
LLYLGLATPLAASNLSRTDAERPQTANPTLREYFLERYWDVYGGRTDRDAVNAADIYRGYHRDPFADQFVDVQVERFLDDLEKKLTRLETAVEALQAARQYALEAHLTSDPSLRKRFARLAEMVGHDAGDLHHMVSAVAADLPSKDPSGFMEGADSPDFFGAEVEYLVTHVGKAEGGIRDIFLEPTNTVTVEELGGDNVLTELRSIERMTKEIRRVSEIGRAPDFAPPKAMAQNDKATRK